jgi:hypothetical protein
MYYLLISDCAIADLSTSLLSVDQFFKVWEVELIQNAGSTSLVFCPMRSVERGGKCVKVISSLISEQAIA